MPRTKGQSEVSGESLMEMKDPPCSFEWAKYGLDNLVSEVEDCYVKEFKNWKTVTSLVEIQFKEMIISDLKTQFQSCQRDVVLSLSVVSDDAIIKASKDTVSKCKSRLNECFLSLFEAKKVWEDGNSQQTASRATTSVGQSSSPTKLHAAKLPKIGLPEFSGKPEDWLNFRDLFSALVVTNDALDSVHKMSYLKSQLKGDAALQIKNYALAEGHFEEAWSEVNKRYDNKREIIMSLIRKLVDAKPVTSENGMALQRLIDVVTEALRSLKVLERKVSEWDDLLVFLVQEKLDNDTRKEWSKVLPPENRMPTFKELTEFLVIRIRSLQSISKGSSRKENATRVHHSTGNTEASPHKCEVCDSEARHPIYKCPKFVSMDVPERHQVASKHKRCFSCLSNKHSVKDCKSEHKCRHCNGNHHSLLHGSRSVPKSATSYNSVPPPPISSSFTTGGVINPPSPVSASTSGAIIHSASASSTHSQPLLATAIVNAEDSGGCHSLVRVFLDAGAQGNLISEACVRRLGLPRTSSEQHVYGVGNTYICQSRGSAVVTLLSRLNSYSLTVKALIMPRVTTPQPDHPLDTRSWKHLKGIQLADPHFHTPSDIDMILDVSCFFSLLNGQKIEGPPGTPSALNTKFGWIVGGDVVSSAEAQINIVRVHQVALYETTEIVQRFWTLEEVPHVANLTQEERNTESHFVTTTARLPDGRYETRLPFKSSPKTLGASKEMATRRLLSLERRLLRHPKAKPMYIDFMREYEQLGHMRKLEPSEDSEVIGASNYIPHHFVLKEDSTTTKLRVVFDASAATSNGVSLNSILMVGPKVQDDLFDTLLGFRLHAVALKADIKQMYRQIRVNPTDTPFLRILWREDHGKPIETFELTTVTYGTSSAPYTATRTLKQLSEDATDLFPYGAKLLGSKFYVDDLMASFPDASTAVEAQRQLTGLLSTAGMELRKWDSNLQGILVDIPSSLRERNPDIDNGPHTLSKALGISWDSTTDMFLFTGFVPEVEQKLTKRHVLSEMSRIFDPLGLLAPMTIRVKIFFQRLWEPVSHSDGEVVLDWDDELPDSLLPEWHEYIEGIQSIPQLQIPRCLIPAGNGSPELHGFSDASSCAYSAVVYLKTTALDNSTTIRLIAAKTRVAPRKAVSIPRLELCGGLLLARLINAIQNTLALEARIFTWTDSEIVLRWVSCSSRRFDTFVANRVAAIQELIPSESWRYVPTALNPADCASRGISAAQLVSHDLWWVPSWLCLPTTPLFASPQRGFQPEVLEERRLCNLVTVRPSLPSTLLTRFSNLTVLVRVTTFILRFIANCRIKDIAQRLSGRLSCAELTDALNLLVRTSQEETFSSELAQLKQKGQVTHSSSLLSLNPFLDSRTGLIKVGGRLQNSPLPDSAKYPILLAPHHQLTRVIVEDCHRKLLHAGFQLLWANLRRKYWIPRARNLIRSILRKCTTCQRFRAEQLQQLMGSLPRPRVNPSARAFQTVGIDFAGPFNLQATKGRGKKQFKAYFCIFVCFSSKAVHLEAVTELSTSAFLACLRRFVARRGIPADIHSDNGTNFVGSDRELRRLLELSKADEVSHFTTERGISWHFLPPGAPHQGGLWEAGVKSTKYHLRRVVGANTLTLEEFWTLLCQTEAALNSRPLCAMSEDPSDYDVLTPGHLLIGQPLTALPEEDVTDMKINRLTRWQHLTQMFQHFWKRWSTEYLTSLQQRYKWVKKVANVQVGDLVIIRDENLSSPLKWKMGRVSQIHPGADGLVRVVTLKTASGSFQRPVTKIAPLLRFDD